MAIKQFTSRVDTIPFAINDAQFEAAGELAADAFIDFLGVVGELGRAGQQANAKADSEEEGGTFDIEQLRRQKDLMAQAVNLCIPEAESRDRILDGLAGKPDAPSIPLDLLQEVLMWLMEEYKLAKADEDEDEEGAVGERPTKGTSDSATGSPSTEAGSEDD
jgi:hypothetical protein